MIGKLQRHIFDEASKDLRRLAKNISDDKDYKDRKGKAGTKDLQAGW